MSHAVATALSWLVVPMGPATVTAERVDPWARVTRAREHLKVNATVRAATEVEGIAGMDAFVALARDRLAAEMSVAAMEAHAAAVAARF